MYSTVKLWLSWKALLTPVPPAPSRSKHVPLQQGWGGESSWALCGDANLCSLQGSKGEREGASLTGESNVENLTLAPAGCSSLDTLLKRLSGTFLQENLCTKAGELCVSPSSAKLVLALFSWMTCRGVTWQVRFSLPSGRRCSRVQTGRSPFVRKANQESPANPQAMDVTLSMSPVFLLASHSPKRGSLEVWMQDQEQHQPHDACSVCGLHPLFSPAAHKTPGWGEEAAIRQLHKEDNC